MSIKLISKITLFFGITVIFSQNAFAEPKNAQIISSIKPIDSLVRMIAEDVNITDLLISGNQSPHGFDLKPSDVVKLNNAKIIFYIDDTFEEFLPNILENSKDITKINLSQMSDLRLYKTRTVTDWKVEKAHKDEKYIDYHFWLDTKNAKAILLTIANELTKIYPENLAIYDRNYKASINQIDALFNDLEEQLKGLENEKFMVFHDAFQYFENQFGLNNVGYISKNPHLNVSIKSLQQNMVKVKREKIKCVFSEPQFNRKFSKMVAKYGNAKVLDLDPDGFDMEPSKTLYFELMKKNANAFKTCLVDVKIIYKIK